MPLPVQSLRPPTFCASKSFVILSADSMRSANRSQISRRILILTGSCRADAGKNSFAAHNWFTVRVTHACSHESTRDFSDKTASPHGSLSRTAPLAQLVQQRPNATLQELRGAGRFGGVGNGVAGPEMAAHYLQKKRSLRRSNSGLMSWPGGPLGPWSGSAGSPVTWCLSMRAERGPIWFASMGVVCPDGGCGRMLRTVIGKP